MGAAVAAGATAVGAGLQAYGSLKAGKEEARATRFAQKQTELQGEQFISNARFEQEQFEEQAGYNLNQFALTEADRQRVFKLQAKQVQTQSAQAEAARREDLTASLETLMALRAGRGVGSGSPTGMGIANALISDEISDIRTERVNAMSQIEELRRAGLLSEEQVKMLRETTERQVSRSRANTKGQIKLTNKQLALSRANTRKKAKASLLAGYIGAGAAIAGGASSIAKKAS